MFNNCKSRNSRDYPGVQNSDVIMYFLSEFRNDASWFIQLVQQVSYSLRRVVIIIFAKDFPSHYSKAFSELNNVNLYFINLDLNSRFKSAMQLIKLIRQVKPSLVHAHGYFASAISIPISIMYGITHRIVTRHHGLLHLIERKYKSALIDGMIRALCTKLIVHSQHLKDSMIKGSESSKKVVHISLGILVEDFLYVSNERVRKLRSDLGICENKVLIGLNARPVKWKGVEVFLDSAKILSRDSSNFHFLLVNMHESASRRRLEDISVDLPVTFVETVSDLPAFYKMIDVFCHVPTSRTAEPAGFVYLESIASGVPCVFTVSGILPEIDLRDLPISVVDYCSPRQLSKAIVELAGATLTSSDQIRKERLQNFTLSNFVDAHILLYKKLLSQH